MKKFIKKVTFFICFCLVILIVPSYFIDPYNVFHWDCIRNNGVEPNKNYIKTKYVINNPDKFEGYVFGSSRVGSIHTEKISGYKVYNMTYSGGTPKEFYETLKTFVDEGINIEVVYLGLDNQSYTSDPETHLKQGLRSPYQYLKNAENFYKLYINPYWSLQSLKTIFSDGRIEGFDSFYEYGWSCEYNHISKYDWESEILLRNETMRMKETITEISDIKNLCDENEIDLIVFTNPLYEEVYVDAITNAQYYDFIKELATITDFYNFSGINSITKDTNNYIDYSHYTAEIGDLLISKICANEKNEELEKQGFGWYVTQDNVQDLIKLLQTQY